MSGGERGGPAARGEEPAARGEEGAGRGPPVAVWDRPRPDVEAPATLHRTDNCQNWVTPHFSYTAPPHVKHREHPGEEFSLITFFVRLSSVRRNNEGGR